MAPRRSNAAAVGWLVRRLRHQDRIDELGEVVAVLAATSGRLVDEAVAPDSDVPIYARAQAIRAHAVALEQLARLLNPPEADGFGELLRVFATPAAGAGADPDASPPFG